MRSSIILTVPFAAMALGQVVRSPLWIRTSIDFSINLYSFDESQTPSLKKAGLAKCCPFFSPTPSASSPASRQSSPLSLCQWPLRQHRSLYPSLLNHQLSPSLLPFQLASTQPWVRSRFPLSPLAPWWFRRQSQTPPSPLEPSRQQPAVPVPSQRLEQQPREQRRAELLRAQPAQPQHHLTVPLVWCNPFSAWAWLAQSSPPSSKQTPPLGFGLRKYGGGDG